ncbi:glycogen debranching protein GlgX [Spirochaeta lutea]|uniref:glycogen debranching protein GlgX n=1 Tax=Spirochaeta lutea TaxID=1480694 RepID=UPI0009DFF187|nr:glycogen debranching protein GlgX [Spirochaeta lutea]
MAVEANCNYCRDLHDDAGNTITVRPGKALPFGATLTPHGVQFSLFSRHATMVSLCLFSDSQDDTPTIEIDLIPEINRTGDCWHVLVEGIAPGQLYLYRVDGPYEPSEGHRFNANKLLIDPYAKALTGDFQWNLGEALGYDPESPEQDLSFSTTFDAAVMPKCIVIDDDRFDWQGDRPLNYPLYNTVIYEAHVKGLSKHPSSGVEHPGTFRGVIEMIPYLTSLGITSLELLPIQEFDEYEYNHRSNPETGQPLTNYWGYSSLAFFAPKARYCADGYRGEQVDEFKEMVRELHKAGIEVILDIVFNHTGEGDQMGHTLSFRGIDNSIYYILDENKRYYKNFSGCGNTLNCNHPVVRGLIIDSLRYWVQEMHVDGFRFDLGSILGRDQFGNLMENPPVINRIAEDPVLRGTKIIAEAWDAGGAYQVGSFPGGRWAEWNDRYRDTLRSYWRNDRGVLSDFATRFSGSSDLYKWNGRKPYHSINYVTAHDGFTLNDIVTYNEKHNFANGEENRDGHNHNITYNYGFEGETSDWNINENRNRQVKNFLASLLLSTGTPMMLAGDEFRRTQKGNNNAYCHDTPLSWMDYGDIEKHRDIFRFLVLVIQLRKEHPALQRQEFYLGKDLSDNQVLDIGWYNEYGSAVDWNRAENLLALRIDGSKKEIHADQDDWDFYIMMNPGLYDQYFSIPKPPAQQHWARIIDTAQPSPGDFLEPRDEKPLKGRVYLVESRSMVVLISRRD